MLLRPMNKKGDVRTALFTTIILAFIIQFHISLDSTTMIWNTYRRRFKPALYESQYCALLAIITNSLYTSSVTVLMIIKQLELLNPAPTKHAQC